MTGPEIVYLAFVLIGFGALSGALAFASWDEKRRQARLGIDWYRKD